MKRILISFFLLVSIIAICVGCSKAGQGEYALTIDGDKISIGEYKMYLNEQKKSFEAEGGEDIWDADFDGVSAEKVAKENAINSIVLVKAAVKQAKELGISLDEAEMELVGEESQKIYDNYTDEEKAEIGLEYDEIYNIIEENHIQQKVFEFVTDGLEISPSEMESYIEDYYKENLMSYRRVWAKFVHKANDEAGQKEMAEIQAALWNGDGFDNVVNGASEVELVSGMFSDEILEKLFSYNEGDITEKIEVNNNSYIFYITRVDDSKKDELKSSLEESYTLQKKQEIYNTQNKSWTASTQIEKNIEVWDSIEIIK